jgi:hypothetical protein
MRSATGERPASILLACRPPIRRLLECRFAAPLLVPAHFCPQNPVGGRNGLEMIFYEKPTVLV